MNERALRDLSFDFRAARTVMAAVSLGVIERLASEPADAKELARSCELDLRGAEALLAALAALGVVRVVDERYALAEAARRVLVGTGDRSRRSIVLHDLWHWGLWARLEASIRSGEPVAERRCDPFFSDPAVLAAFYPNLARAHPGLELEVMDLPPVAREASRALELAGLAERVTVRGASFLTDALDPGGSGYDVVLLSRVLMGLPDPAASELLARVRAALRPGGRALVHEFRRGDGPGERVGALLDLDMLLLTGGAVRAPARLAALLEAAGLEDVAARPFGSLGVLVEGRA